MTLEPVDAAADEPGRDHVDRDAVPDLGSGRRPGQREQARFGHGIGGDRGEGAEVLGPAEAKVDDPPPLPLAHAGESGLHAEVGPKEVAPQDPVSYTHLTLPTN